MDNIVIRKAEPNDCEEILKLIKELAEFENMPDQVKMTADTLRKDCFGERPYCSCQVATTEQDTKTLIGFTLFYPTYSTWEGVSLYLEDLYVQPSYRGKGVGRKLWLDVIKIAFDMGCSRLNLAVLDWNKHAKDMYTRYGLKDLTQEEDWHLMRLSREGMEELIKKQ